MISEAFAAGDSIMHRLDPRLKVAAATAFAVVTALSNRFPSLVAALCLSIFLVSLARLGWRGVLKRLLIVNGFVLFLWILLPLTAAGPPVFSFGPLHWTREGVLLATRITLKSNAIMLVLIALVATSSVATLGHVLNRFRIPEKLVYLLLLSYRYTFVIEQEYGRLARAIKARSFTPRTGLHTYRTYAYLIGMLFVRSAARADRVYQAMLCRGFRGRFYTLDNFSFTPTDLLWTIGLSAALIGLGSLEWTISSL